MAWNGLSILRALSDGSAAHAPACGEVGRIRRGNNLAKCACKHAAPKRARWHQCTDGVHQITKKGRAALAEGREITSGPCGGAATSRKENTLRTRAWRFIRMRDGFSVEDVMFALCDGTETDAECNLANYMLALEAAGYLTPMRRGNAGQRRWKLKRDRDTGPEAPAWNKATRILRDHNTGEAFTIPRKQETRRA